MEQKKGLILWIDDEIERLKPHIILLTQRGYEVETATGAEDALVMLGSKRYDLILLDEMMLGMSGLEALPKIKELHPTTPVIMATKSEAESLMEDAIGNKIDDYLTKPLNPAQILAACKKFLEGDRLATQRLTQEYAMKINQVSQRLMDNLDWQEWKDLYVQLVNWSIELDKYPDIGFKETIRDIFRQANSLYSDYIENNYVDWLKTNKYDDAPIFSPQILDKFVAPLLKNNKPTFFIVVDCMRLDQWQEMEEVLLQMYNIKRDYYSAILPTATPYARNSLLSGLYPIDIQKHYPQWWVGEKSDDESSQNAYEKQLLEAYIDRKKIKLNKPPMYVKIIDTDFGKKVENEILKYTQNQLTAIVVNAVDMIAHSRSDYPILKEIAPDESAYRSLTRSWFNHSSFYGILKTLSNVKDVQIVITTDHGSVRCLRGVKALGDRETTTCLRYKFGKNVKADSRYAMQINKPEDFKLPHQGVTVSNVIAKEDYYFVYPTDYHYYVQRYRDSFQHGGISLEEMILPVAILEPKS